MLFPQERLTTLLEILRERQHLLFNQVAHRHLMPLLLGLALKTHPTPDVVKTLLAVINLTTLKPIPSKSVQFGEYLFNFVALCGIKIHEYTRTHYAHCSNRS